MSDTSSAQRPPIWAVDPFGRHELRYWDGVRWTEHVADAGVQAVDPPTAARPGTSEMAPAPTQGDQAETSSQDRIPLFGGRARARALQAEVERLKDVLDRMGAWTLAEREAHLAVLAGQIAEQEASLAAMRTEAQRERGVLDAELSELRRQVVETRDEQILQELGVYEYRHPLTDAVAYQSALRSLRDQVKAMARADGGAVLATTDWTVNGSRTEGQKMVRETSKLLLRAYNAEADNLVRGLKPYKLATAIERLDKVAATIEKLGGTMNIRIAAPFHQLRIAELELTADFLEKQAEEKEREREERERLREERKAQQEMERERARLEKERQHYANALAALEIKGDQDAAARLREQLAGIDRAIEDVDYRAANIRAGYVYVISNLGAFGEQMVKIGLTRRLDPLERVRELGDASVPFRFDVHAVFFAEDAVSIETALHQRFADRRVNRVNLRREFFYATPGDVKTALTELAGELLEFEETPEAIEYRQSLSLGATT